MSIDDEKTAFSQRLKQQLAKRDWPVNSPTWLAREFNQRYTGKAVSVQGASNWLGGVAIPSQEKLRVLATWLDVPVQWLRYGEHSAAAETDGTDGPGKAELEQARQEYAQMQAKVAVLPDKMAQLSVRQKCVVYDVVSAMLDKETGK